MPRFGARQIRASGAEAGSYEIPQAAQALKLNHKPRETCAAALQVLLDSGRFDGVICTLDKWNK